MYRQRFAAFADHLGDRLSPRRRGIYERAIACGDRLADRLRTRRDLTVVHGDAHAWNALHSPDGDVRVDRLGRLASSLRPPMTSPT